MNIKDIATAADVSVSTVSKVINRKDQDISAATRKRVLKVVQEYQYVPYSKIRKAVSGRSNLLAVLIAGEGPGQMELLRAVEGAGVKYGYSIAVCILKGDRETEERQVKVMGGKHADGCLLLGDFLPRADLVKELQTELFPCVAAGPKSNEALMIPTVIYDEEQAAYEAVSYLTEKRHTAIGCMLSGESVIERGYQRALYERGIDFDKNRVFKADITAGEGREQLKDWLSIHGTAILCQDASGAICLYQLLQKIGLSVPNDISVICMRDSLYLKLLNPPVTAMENGMGKLGREAVALAAGLIESRETACRSQTGIEIVRRDRKSVSPPAAGRRGQKLVVVGSMNMDVTITVPHIPADGETLIAAGMALMPGGKGANQAAGVSKLGGKAYLIGCLGNDGDGKEIYNALVGHKVYTQGIVFDSAFPTGKAYINVSGDEHGESNIVIYPGANQRLDREHLRKNEGLFEGAKYCLLSLEIPFDTARYAVSICRQNQVEVIVKPSGAKELKEDFIRGISYLVPNKKELDQLVPGGQSVEEKAKRLWNMGAGHIIVTLGNHGCYLKDDSQERFFAAADFAPVDTTGGADAFISALAVYLSEGVSLVQAIGFASYSAGISITRPGVLPAMPDRVGVDMYQDIIYKQFQDERNSRRER